MRHTLRNLNLALAVLGMAAISCGGGSSGPPPPADLKGDYQGNLTNGTSSCPGTWSNGAQTSVTFHVTQSGANASVEVMGAAGVQADLALGSRIFSGLVTGSTLNATLLGTREQTQGNCRYTLRADLTGKLTNNTLEGTVVLTPQPITISDCQTAKVTGCSMTQSFNGIRPAA